MVSGGSWAKSGKQGICGLGIIWYGPPPLCLTRMLLLELESFMFSRFTWLDLQKSVDSFTLSVNTTPDSNTVKLLSYETLKY